MVHILLGDNVGTHKTFSVQDIFAASRTQCEFFEPNTSMVAQPNDDIVNRWVKMELENIVGQIRLEHFIEYRDDLFSRHGKDKVHGGRVDIEQCMPPKLNTAEVLNHFMNVWENIVASPKWPKSLFKSWRKLCLVPNADDTFTVFRGFNSFKRTFATDGSPMEPKFRLGPLISGVIVESRSGTTEFESDKPDASGISFAQPALSDSTLSQAPAAPHSGTPPDSPAAAPTAEKELRVSEQLAFGTVNIKLTTCWLGAWLTSSVAIPCIVDVFATCLFEEPHNVLARLFFDILAARRVVDAGRVEALTGAFLEALVAATPALDPTAYQDADECFNLVQRALCKPPDDAAQSPKYDLTAKFAFTAINVLTCQCKRSWVAAGSDSISGTEIRFIPGGVSAAADAAVHTYAYALTQHTRAHTHVMSYTSSRSTIEFRDDAQGGTARRGFNRLDAALLALKSTTEGVCEFCMTAAQIAAFKAVQSTKAAGTTAAPRGSQISTVQTIKALNDVLYIRCEPAAGALQPSEVVPMRLYVPDDLGASCVKGITPVRALPCIAVNRCTM